MENEEIKDGSGEPMSLFLPTKHSLEKKVKVYPIGNSYAVLIPKAWLEIFHCDDEEGDFWVEREIDGSTITIKPPERS